MYSPFEELELLADSLPEEGQTVLLTRHDGQLICKPCVKDGLREGVEDAELYGLLVKANQQLHHAGLLPLWVSAIAFLWTSILLFSTLGLQWTHWYILPALGFPTLGIAFTWIRARQRRFFLRRIVPSLVRELNLREIHPHALIGGVRQHAELQTLLDELSFWEPRVNCH